MCPSPAADADGIISPSSQPAVPILSGPFSVGSWPRCLGVGVPEVCRWRYRDHRFVSWLFLQWLGAGDAPTAVQPQPGAAAAPGTVPVVIGARGRAQAGVPVLLWHWGTSGTWEMLPTPRDSGVLELKGEKGENKTLARGVWGWQRISPLLNLSSPALTELIFSPPSPKPQLVMKPAGQKAGAEIPKQRPAPHHHHHRGPFNCEPCAFHASHPAPNV